mgnify:CR=1 FL=1
MVSGVIQMPSKLLKKRTIFDYVNGVIMLGVVVVTLYPVVNIIALSFSRSAYILANKVTFYPIGFNVDAYRMILSNNRIPRAYLNTILYTGVGTAINLVATTLAAYPLSRRDFFGRKLFITMVVITMFFNGGLRPRYIVVSRLGMINTIWALVIPNAIWTFELLILKTFFQSLDSSVYESAIIDGASEYRILGQILVPLSTAALASISLFYFMGHWNSYFIPMIYLNDMRKFPLQVVLRDMLIEDTARQQLAEAEQWKQRLTPDAVKNATIFITMIPVLMVYPFAQRYFVRGVMIGSVKG